MKKLTAIQQRFFDNAVLVAALQLIFTSLEKFGIPICPLHEIADTTSGGTPNRSVSQYYGGNIPWIKSGELNDGLIERSEEYITDAALQNSSAKVYPKGTLVVALYGATVGKTGILSIDAASNQAVCAITPTTNRISTNFLFWFLRYKRPDFLKNSFGGAQPNISQKILRETLIPIPAIDLQKEICSFLEVIELRQKGIKNLPFPNLPPPLSNLGSIVARIEELAAKIEEARGLRRDAVEEVDIFLSRTLRDAFEPYYDKMVLIGNEFKVTTGSTPSRSNPMYWGGEVKWVSSGEVAFCRIADTVQKITELGLNNSSAKVYPPNTVLIAMIGQGKTRGQTAILDCYAATNQNVAAIHVYETIHVPEYVYWWLRSRYYESRSAETGTAQPALSGERVKQIPIPLPSIEEQRRIVSYLDSIQTKVNILKPLQTESSAELDALLPSILDKAFKGELL